MTSIPAFIEMSAIEGLSWTWCKIGNATAREAECNVEGCRSFAGSNAWRASES